MNKTLSGLLLATALGGVQVEAAPIVSNFDTGAEGWQLVGDASGKPWAEYGSGYIYGRDAAQGGLWYFQAPDKFLGNMLGAYGEAFSFDFNHSGSGRYLGASSFVTIWGAGTSMVMAGPVPPKSTWSHYSFDLEEGAGWLTAGVETSEDVMKQILSDITQIRIRGEYIYSTDTGYLDNVSLRVPEPGTLLLLGMGLLILSGVSRRKA